MRKESGTAFDKFVAGLDFTRLPTVSHIASFFGPAFSYAEKDRDGIHSQMLLFYEERK